VNMLYAVCCMLAVSVRSIASVYNNQNREYAFDVDLWIPSLDSTGSQGGQHWSYLPGRHEGTDED
ncbi:hypothetical protein RRG08_001889, partial [Elysia crispata]